MDVASLIRHRAPCQTFAHHDRLFFFQFPEPFPTFVSKSKSDSIQTALETSEATPTATTKDKGKGVDRERKVSFAEDTKPPGPSGPSTNGAADTESKEDQKVEGLAGQLEIYASGAVKMRMGNGIVYDVSLTLNFRRNRSSHLYTVILTICQT